MHLMCIASTLLKTVQTEDTKSDHAKLA